jgi:hypothetical protein
LCHQHQHHSVIGTNVIVFIGTIIILIIVTNAIVFMTDYAYTSKVSCRS